MYIVVAYFNQKYMRKQQKSHITLFFDVMDGGDKGSDSSLQV